MNVNTLYKLAIRFEKQAQVVSAQPGDIQNCLENAKLWNLSTAVSPILNQAGVPDDASVNISILVSEGPSVAYDVVLTPPNPKVSAQLNRFLKQKLSTIMTNALKTAKLNVTDVVTVKWLTF
jgi:hypothetical protein